MKTIKKFISATTATLMLGSMLAAFPQSALKASALRGEGTKENPYYVLSYDELEGLMDTFRHENGEGETYIELIGDIISEDSKNDYNFYMSSSFDHTIHLDLAGHNLTRNARTTDEAMFMLSSNATLIIEDSKGNGSISCKINSSNKIESMFNVSGGGKLIINGGKFSCMGEGNQANYIVHDQGGNTYINGGEFSGAYTLVEHDSGYIRFSGGNFIQEKNPENTETWDIKSSYNAYQCVVTGKDKDATLYFTGFGSLTDNHVMGIYTFLRVNDEAVPPYEITLPIIGRKIEFVTGSVGEFNISVTPPIEGNTITQPMIHSLALDINSHSWTDMTTGEKLDSTKNFIAGRQYKLTVNVSGKSSQGWVLYKTPKVILNNKELEDVKVRLDAENSVDCSYIFTASEKNITNVDLRVKEPWDDQRPSQPELNHDNVRMTGYRWYEEDGTTRVSSTSTFVGGKKYILKIDLTPLNACTFDSKMRAMLNGEDITVDYLSPTSVTVWRSYTAIDPVLTEVRMTVATPMDGEKPARPVAAQWCNIESRMNYSWFLLDENGNIKKTMGNDDVFESGKSYMLDCNVWPIEGYKFSPDLKAYVNSMEGTLLHVNDATTQFRVKFENIDPVLSKIDFKITPPKPGAEHEREAQCLEPNAYTGVIVKSPKGGNQFKEGYFSWFDAETGEELIAAGEKFVGGKTYTAVFIVYAKNGYRIDKNTKVYVNGKEAHTDYVDFSGAVKYTVDFVATAESDDSSSPDKTFALGDVNADGNIDVEDAVMVIGHVNGVKALTADEEKRADIDKNSDIDIEDAVAIIAHVNGVKAIV